MFVFLSSVTGSLEVVRRDRTIHRAAVAVVDDVHARSRDRGRAVCGLREVLGRVRETLHVFVETAVLLHELAAIRFREIGVGARRRDLPARAVGVLDVVPDRRAPVRGRRRADPARPGVDHVAAGRHLLQPRVEPGG